MHRVADGRVEEGHQSLHAARLFNERSSFVGQGKVGERDGGAFKDSVVDRAFQEAAEELRPTKGANTCPIRLTLQHQLPDSPGKLRETCIYIRPYDGRIHHCTTYCVSARVPSMSAKKNTEKRWLELSAYTLYA